MGGGDVCNDGTKTPRPFLGISVALSSKLQMTSGKAGVVGSKERFCPGFKMSFQILLSSIQLRDFWENSSHAVSFFEIGA